MKKRENPNRIRKRGASNPTRIRNGKIRRDFKRLLAIIADAREPDYSEVEAIAKRNGFYYNDKGEVRDI